MSLLTDEQLQEICAKIFNLDCYDFASKKFYDTNHSTGKPLTRQDKLFLASLRLSARTEIGSHILSALSLDRPVSLIVDEHYNDNKKEDEQVRGYCTYNHIIAITNPNIDAPSCANTLIHELTHEIQFQTQTDTENLPTSQDRFMIKHLMEAEACLYDKIFDVELAQALKNPIPYLEQESKTYAALKADQSQNGLSEAAIRETVLKEIYLNDSWLKFYQSSGLGHANRHYTHSRTRHHGKSAQITAAAYMRRIGLAPDKAAFFLNPENVPNYPKDEVAVKTVQTTQNESDVIHNIYENNRLVCRERCAFDGTILYSIRYDNERNIVGHCYFDEFGIKIKETATIANGSLLIRYDAQQRPSETVQYDKYGNPVFKTLHTYHGTLTTSTLYNFIKNIKISEETTDYIAKTNTKTEFAPNGKKKHTNITDPATSTKITYDTDEKKISKEISDRTTQPITRTIVYYTPDEQIAQVETYQNAHPIKKDIYDNGIKNTELRFDSDGTLSEITYFTYDGPLEKRTVYNRENQVIAEITHNPETGIKTTTEKETFGCQTVWIENDKDKTKKSCTLYDNNGQKTQEIFFDNSAHTPRKTIISYNPDGQICHTATYQGEDLSSETQYKNGKKTEEIKYNFSLTNALQIKYDADEQPSAATEYTETEQGLTISKISYKNGRQHRTRPTLTPYKTVQEALRAATSALPQIPRTTIKDRHSR